MSRYKVIRKRITFSASRKDDATNASSDQETYEPGEVIEDPPEAVLRAFGDRLEEVSQESTEQTTDLPDPGEYTIDEFEELLGDGEYDDHLDELHELEKEGNNRDGMIEVIEDRQ